MRGWARLGAGSLVWRARVGAEPVGFMGAALALLGERSGLLPEPPPLAGGVAGLPPTARGDWTGVARGAVGVGMATGLAASLAHVGTRAPAGYRLRPGGRRELRAENREGPAVGFELFAADAVSAGGIHFTDADRVDLRAAGRCHVRDRNALVDDPGAVADDRGGRHCLVVNLRRLLVGQGIMVQVAVGELADRDKRIGVNAQAESKAAVDALPVEREPDCRLVTRLPAAAAPSRNSSRYIASTPRTGPRCCPASSTTRNGCGGTSGHSGTAPSPRSNPTANTTRNRYRPSGRHCSRAASRG